jgi:thymidylate synthase (FAD)
MQVRLVSWSQTAPEFESVLEDAQDLVAYCARVSNPTNQINSSTSQKLIEYLIRNAHWSPLEMVSVCMEINTTRDIARQLLRHRSFSFQEFSQRYANPVADLEFTLREARLQDETNRQNSIEVEDERLQSKWSLVQADVIQSVKEAYNWALENGIAKEQARAVLPEGLMMSRVYVNGTLRSWIHYIQLRAANGTQKEHQEIALACAEVISKIFPMAKELTNG